MLHKLNYSRRLLLGIIIGLLLTAFGFFCGLGYFLGTALLFYLLGILLTKSKSVSSDKPQEILPLALSFPILGNIWIIAQWLPLLALPYGTDIRPMLLAPLMLFASTYIMVAGIVTAYKHFRDNENRLQGIIGLLLSLLPIAVMYATLFLVMKINGLSLAQ